ncbi:MAG TPA: MFS transporter [Candidatus Polarisedimenticolia bacterium]|nr:MFS transporter [Candidatus Polarisedimenticolia bacterium]
MGLTERWREIRAGFEPAFWVANFTEIFERVAYYGTTAVLAIFLTEQLHFSSELTGWLMGISGFVVYSLPILAGTLADRFGFRRALMFAYLVLTAGYFLLGSVTAPWMAPLRGALGDKWLVLAILMIPALGPGMVKPCVAGTIARTSTEDVRSLGYSIYYTLVNIGGAVGPLMAWLVRERLGLGMENVFRVASVSVFAMFWVTLVFYREPAAEAEAKVASVWDALKNMFVVLRNFRFVTFLLISSGFYIVFWQIWISAPIFLRRYVEANANVDRMLSVEAVTVISFQILVTYLTRKMGAVQSIALGFLITGLSFVLLAVHPTIGMFVVMLVVMALGEITQASRYYEYCSRLAPPGQQGLYMGYAFLPIAIGYFIAGPVGGYLLREFGEVRHQPRQMWWVVVAIGVVTAALMWLYDKIARPQAVSATS